MKNSVEPLQPYRQPQMIEVMLTLERPPSAQLAGYSRSEKYRLLQDNSEEIRSQLVDWIEKEGLSDKIGEIDEATVFNVLFVECTPEAAMQLKNAPGVKSVQTIEDLDVDLPLPKKDSITDAIDDVEDEADWW